MLFNVSISPAGPSAPNFNVQVEAPDLIAALEGAKAPILKSANEASAIITSALPSARPGAPAEAAPEAV